MCNVREEACTYEQLRLQMKDDDMRERPDYDGDAYPDDGQKHAFNNVISRDRLLNRRDMG